MLPDVAFFGAVGSFRGELVELNTTRRAVQLSAHDSLYVCSFLQPRRALYRMGGRVLDREEFRAGEALVQPVGVDFSFEMMTETKSVGLFVPKTVLETTLGAHVSDLDAAFNALIGTAFRSSLVLSLLERLRGDLVNRSPHGEFVGDELLRAIVAELYTLAHRETPATRTATYTLSAVELDRVDTYIRENLDVRVTIADLARVAGMPAAELTASLKATTQLTPYQYVLQRRLEAARGMITGTEFSLSEIAFRCGFSSQSHMTNVFSSKTGITPASIRRSAR